MVGIPYADVIVTTSAGAVTSVIRQCPTCPEQIVEQVDRTGEMLTNRYADHYEKEHATEMSARYAEMDGNDHAEAAQDRQ